ncbi:hypothetical protein BD779DRAFT_1475809 [Infundibulicybe gibba]|nr:hypothetical protein BD779DRAFT_1475809 [Infundibulicybe gibba]
MLLISSFTGRKIYVEWALPDDPEDPTPFTWLSVDESDPEKPIFSGNFLAQTVLATFAHHLTLISTVHANDLRPGNPIGALAMTATAIERAFIAWATGEFIAHGARVDAFSTQWASTTAFYVTDLLAVTEGGWGRIAARANEALEKLNMSRQVEASVQSNPRVASRRSQVIDAADSG